jgi:hypothetical protein
MEKRREVSGGEDSGVHPISTEPFTAMTSDLKTVQVQCRQARTLARRLSVRGAAKVGNRATACQVIFRNTHKPQNSQDNQCPSAASTSRSQSLLTAHKTVTLTPRRNERIRLKYALSDVDTG